jgi:carbon-monoxide dehydrogenase small subunit
MEVKLTVNGAEVVVDAEPRTLLVHALRDNLGLTGTHVGCDTAQCGCCTVLVDGDAVKSCTMLLAQADGCAVQTIEGLATDGKLHPVQQAFSDCHALQCGYCTPGFVMSSVELTKKYQNLTEEKVRHLLEGNICRCTGYTNIVRAILAVATDSDTARKAEEADNV